MYGEDYYDKYNTKAGVSKQLGVSNLVQDKMIKELYKAGMNFYKIAQVLDLPIKNVRQVFSAETDSHPKNALDEGLVDRILYENGYEVTLDVIVSNEKERFKAYSKLESTCLDVMNKLLTYYASQPVGVDLKADQFTAKLATDFIRVTHNARQELIQKYAVDKMSDKKDEGIKIQFIEGETNDKDTSDI